VAKVGAEMVGLDFENSKIITCHIGNGGSVTAVLNGKSFDTSMGFSPLDGLMMGTRCGSVDASAITYIGENEGMTYAELNSMMNKRSGVLALSELSSDMRDIDDAYDAGNEKAIVARDMYYNRVKKFVGEYAAEMGGVDLLIFTGGVGENSADLRRYVCENMQFMGIEIDESINIKTRGTNTLLSTPEAKVKVAVIATNEELVIATDTYNLTKNL
ncbi:MAG: acetate kinase, partial [Alistipes sp.]|nr:acetate kinase [Alistipes sp.]